MKQRLRLLRELERKVLWLSAWTVHHANHLRPNRDGLKVGGHQASCASLATVMTALYFSVLRPEDRVAVKPHASPVFHAIQYLFGHQTRDKLERFRALGGAQSYPSRTKDVDDVDFSTGSVGLGVAMTLFSSLVQDYVRLKELGDGRAARPGRMVALVGDAELDEGNIFEALLEGWKHDVRNLWWVIDYNRQSLDGVVNDRLFGRIGEMFELVGWRVVTLKYGKLLETAFAQPDGEHLRQWIDDCPNSLYSALVYMGGAGWREALTRDLNQYPGIRRILEQHDDAALHRLMTNLAGNDMQAVLDAFEGVDDDTADLLHRLHHQGPGPALRRPQGQPFRPDDARPDGGLQEGHGRSPTARNGTSSPASPSPPAELQAFLDARAVQRRGPPPHRGAGRGDPGRAAAAERQEVEHPGRLRQDPERHRRRGQRARPRASSRPRPTSRSRPISAPGSTGAACGPIPRPRTCSASSRSCRPSCGARRRAASIIELGIAENNLFIQLAAMGLSHQLFGARLLPIGTLYDPFIARGLDALNYACYQDARFMIVATPSGVTLAPEGGAHQSIHTPLIGIGQPGLLSYEPAYVDELAVLMRHRAGLHAAGQGRLGLSPALDPQPAAARSARCRPSRRPTSWPAATGTQPPEPGADIAIVAMGAVTPEAIAAHESVARDFAGAGLLVLTSPDRLHADWLAAQRNRGRTAGRVDRQRRARSSACWRRCRATRGSSPCSTAIRWRCPGWARCAASASCRSASRASASRATFPTSIAPTSSMRRRSSTRWRGRSDVAGPRASRPAAGQAVAATA